MEDIVPEKKDKKRKKSGNDSREQDLENSQNILTLSDRPRRSEKAKSENTEERLRHKFQKMNQQKQASNEKKKEEKKLEQESGVETDEV